MRDHTDTLQLGDQAPTFTLGSANRQQDFRLEDLLTSGPLIVEFLRGTW